MSICYGIFLVPKTAWYPLSSRMFKGLGVLFKLGLSGVCKYSNKMRDSFWILMNRSNGFRMVGLGINDSCGFSVRILSSSCFSPMLTNVFHQIWSESTRSSIRTYRFFVYDFPSSIRFEYGNICSVSFFLLMCDTNWLIYFLFTRIGNLLGEKNARRAGVASNASMMMAFTIGCFLRYDRFPFKSQLCHTTWRW